jgi:hypothetical protein
VENTAVKVAAIPGVEVRKRGIAAAGVAVSLGEGVMVSVAVAVGARVAVGGNGVSVTSGAVGVGTGICVAWKSCVTALHAANRSTENTNKYLFTCNMAYSFLICSTITRKASYCNKKSVLPCLVRTDFIYSPFGTKKGVRVRPYELLYFSFHPGTDARQR